MKQFIFILLAAITLTACSASSASTTTESTEAAEPVDYDSLLADAELLLKMRVDVAMSVCAMNNAVWYDAIHEKSRFETRDYVAKTDDKNRIKGYYSFSEAIANYHASDLFEAGEASLNETESALKTTMKKLKDAPDEYADAFEYLLEAYTASSSLQEAALNPTGTYNDYSTNYHRLKEDYDKAMQKMEVFKP